MKSEEKKLNKTRSNFDFCSVIFSNMNVFSCNLVYCYCNSLTSDRN